MVSLTRALFSCSAGRSRIPELQLVGVRFASRSPGASAVLSQLSSRADTLQPDAGPRTGRTTVVGADQRVLASGSQVLLHDHRELKFLKQVTAAGIFGTLMSSSALAYGVALGGSTASCLGLVVQMT